MKFPVSLVVAGIATAILAYARVSAACTLPAGIMERTVYPGDGAADVPVNARVIVVYQRPRAELPPPALELRVRGGDAVTTTLQRTASNEHEALVLTPSAPLVPHTTYEVTDGIAVPSGCWIDLADCLGEPAVVATFTTGETIDTTAPSLAGARVRSRQLDDDGFCGLRSAVEYDIEVQGGEGASALYHYYRGGTRIAGPLPLVRAGQSCDGERNSVVDLQLDGESFEIRAVDIAGNEETVRHRLRGEPCAGWGCNAGGGAGLLVGLVALAGLGLRRR